MNYRYDIKEFDIIDNKEKLKKFGFEVTEKCAVLQYNLFFNSIFAQICVNFSTKTTQINILESETGDLYLPFYSDFYGIDNLVLDSVKKAYNKLFDELKQNNLLTEENT